MSTNEPNVYYDGSESKAHYMKWKLTLRKETQRSVKKVIQPVFWNMKGPNTIDFLEKDATLHSITNSFGMIPLIY